MKGSAFSLRIGKDIKEARTTNRNEAFKATNRLSGRYKKLEEQKEENRKSYTEKEVKNIVNIITFVNPNQVFIEKPVAPPRSKRDKRQSFKGFKEDRQSLFSSDHTTEDGMDLLPVGRTIAFDCPAEGVHKSDIHVQITGGFATKRWIILVARSAGFQVESRCKTGRLLQPHANHLPANPTGLSLKFYPTGLSLKFYPTGLSPKFYPP